MTDHTPPRKLSRRKFLLYSTAAVVASPFLAYGYAHFIEPFWFTLRRERMWFDDLPDQWVGRTILHLSDLHIGPLVPSDYLIKALQSTHDLKLDLIVITGDMTDHDHHNHDEALKVLSHLPESTFGTVAILGNHDYGAGWLNGTKAQLLSDALQNSGITMLRNQAVEIDGFQVAGTDDLWANNLDGQATLAQLDLSRSALMLTHNPDVCDMIFWNKFKGWILSGHTHGGQCKPPFLPAPILPVMNTRYQRGHYRLDENRDLYISAGLGFIKQVRFNVRPEMILFTLEKSSSA